MQKQSLIGSIWIITDRKGRSKMTIEFDEQQEPDEEQEHSDDVKDAVIQIEEWLRNRKEKESRFDHQRRISPK